LPVEAAAQAGVLDSLLLDGNVNADFLLPSGILQDFAVVTHAVVAAIIIFRNRQYYLVDKLSLNRSISNLEMVPLFEGIDNYINKTKMKVRKVTG